MTRLMQSEVRPIVDEGLNLKLTASRDLQLAVLGDLKENLPEVQAAARAREVARSVALTFRNRNGEIRATKMLTDAERASLRIRAGDTAETSLAQATAVLDAVTRSIEARRAELKSPIDAVIGDTAIGPDLGYCDRYSAMGPDHRAAFWTALEDGHPAAGRMAQGMVRVGVVGGISEADSHRALMTLHHVRNADALAEIRDATVARDRVARSIDEVRAAIDSELALDRGRKLLAA